MDSARYEKVRSLFEEALSFSEAEQQAYLDKACEDESVRAEVLAMLETDRTRSSVLDLPLQQAAQLAFGQQESWLSRQFGRYRTTQFLGEGGMGVVYLAEREDIGSRAAIKILRDATMSPARRARFIEEQRTLARLSHPGIARIYDAETLADGTPWFAMEYVEGVPLSEYCRNLPIRERLTLFRDVCEAVHYAHSQLIVHRDLKPSNILVTNDGAVKLLDFGIAKHLDDVAGTSDGTQTVLRFLTPAYAAPEQVRGEPAGTWTDVYALGIVFYELLTGRRPFDLERFSAVEADRIVAETEPPRPSSVALPRGRKSWADLDLLCLKAMHRDPQRRYRSAEALIRDLDHYLNHEPLEARPDDFWYRAGKFVQRNRRALSATAAALTCIVAIALFFTVRLVAARDDARASAVRAERIQRFMLNLFEGGDSEAGPSEDMKVVSLLERGVQEARALTREPGVQADLNYTLGGLYQKLGELNRADELLRTALEQRTALFGADHYEVANTLRALGLLRLDQSKMEEAEQLARKALDRTLRTDPDNSARVGNAMAALGKVLARRGAYDQALPMLEKAVALQSRGPLSPEASDALTDLANTLYAMGRYDECEAMNAKLLERDRQIYGERHPAVAIDLFNLGNIALDRGQYASAERHFRESLGIIEGWYGKHHPKTASGVLMLGVALESTGKITEAESLYRQALAIQTRVYGQDHVMTGQVLNYLGANAIKQGKLDEAETLFRRTAALFKSALGERHEFYLLQRVRLGEIYIARGKYAEAEPILREAVDGLHAALPADHRYTGIAEIAFGRALAGEKRYRDAEQYLLAGYMTLQKHARSSSREIQSAREALFTLYGALNEPAKAGEFRN